MPDRSDLRNIRRDIVKYGLIILLLLAAGIILLLTGIRQYPLLLGMAVLSFTFGLRHAFDVDHIAAIDNMTRKMLHDGKNTHGVGFCFSLGHSLVVIIMGVLTIFAVKWTQHALPFFEDFGGFVGALVSGCFLLVLAFLNILIVRGIIKEFRATKNGMIENPQTLDSNHPWLNKWIEKLLQIVNHNWQVVLVGFVFGLGFDTATQIAVLATSATDAYKEIPWYAILSFPILFTAGMCIMDTTDGFFMSTAYKWIFTSRLKKIYYNLIVTVISILAASVIGIIEIMQVFSSKIGWTHGFWKWLQDLDFNAMGYFLVGLFAIVWIVSLSLWKLLGLDKKDSGYT